MKQWRLSRKLQKSQSLLINKISEVLSIRNGTKIDEIDSLGRMALAIQGLLGGDAGLIVSS
jgi:hypothetical protein